LAFNKQCYFIIPYLNKRIPVMNIILKVANEVVVDLNTGKICVFLRRVKITLQTNKLNVMAT
jgi:hypothetical protein